MATVAAAACGSCGAPGVSSDRAAPNDNRTPGGTLRDGAFEIALVARAAPWWGEGFYPEGDDSVVTVLAFAEEGSTATIPGPLVRVPEGTEMRITVRNDIPGQFRIGLPYPARRDEGMSALADSVLVVHGLRAGTVEDDTLHVRRGEVREIRYRAERPGTYLYRGAASRRTIDAWAGRDAQLAGAIVVDSAGAVPDPEERIFVITMLDQYPDSSLPPPHFDLFRRAINGRSWPHTERLDHEVGDTLRWRWVNASFEIHPMHLHGFHYRVTATGDGVSETIYPGDRAPLAVTHHVPPGGTFRMEWVPERQGNWIVHCHLLDHIVPVMERDDGAASSDMHDLEQHPLDAMAGLVLGITVSDDTPAPGDPGPARRLRLLAQEGRASDALAREARLDTDSVVRGFVLQAGAEPPVDSVARPGSPLVLTRGESTEITVVNRLTEPTTVHWHGLELESVYDGVAGWSRTESRVAPLIAPGDSFAVRIAPPRAGTFIYHTHMDETAQLMQGMAGPFIVLEPGSTFDRSRDLVFLLGGQTDGPFPVSINGAREPDTLDLRVGTEYRIRVINITGAANVDLTLASDDGPVRWRPLARDGADLPAALRTEEAALLRTSAGETYDFLWTPLEPGDVELVGRYERIFEQEHGSVRQAIRVR
jgi:FtsP/CotA-like multicopper oxidase with cupredoxin domain